MGQMDISLSRGWSELLWLLVSPPILLALVLPHLTSYLPAIIIAGVAGLVIFLKARQRRRRRRQEGRSDLLAQAAVREQAHSEQAWKGPYFSSRASYTRSPSPVSSTLRGPASLTPSILNSDALALASPRRCTSATPNDPWDT